MPPASSFSARVDNQWFPLKPGTRYVYTGVKDGKRSRDVVTVTRQTKKIEGVSCIVVQDRLYLRGRLGERTTDWYSQDTPGNVWYFGEKTAELDAHGHVTSTEGTWTAVAKQSSLRRTTFSRLSRFRQNATAMPCEGDRTSRQDYVAARRPGSQEARSPSWGARCALCGELVG